MLNNYTHLSCFIAQYISSVIAARKKVETYNLLSSFYDLFFYRTHFNNKTIISRIKSLIVKLQKKLIFYRSNMYSFHCCFFPQILCEGTYKRNNKIPSTFTVLNKIVKYLQNNLKVKKKNIDFPPSVK